MLIYESDFLKIDKREELLVHTWTEKELKASDFVKELKVATSFFEKTKSISSVWLQDDFSLIIPPELYVWVDGHILKHQHKLGLQKLVFTIPKKQPILSSLVDIFGNVSQDVQPAYFVNQESALEFAQNTLPKKEQPSISLESNMNKEELQFTINCVNHIESLQSFRIQHQEKFKKLTIREVEVFNLVILGFQNNDIAQKLYITKNTVAGHRKSIIKKLDIKNLNDWINYANVYGIKKPL